jgi:hypothetical protein
VISIAACCICAPGELQSISGADGIEERESSFASSISSHDIPFAIDVPILTGVQSSSKLAPHQTMIYHIYTERPFISQSVKMSTPFEFQILEAHAKYDSTYKHSGLECPPLRKAVNGWPLHSSARALNI